MRGMSEVPEPLWVLTEVEKLNLSLNYLTILPPAVGVLESLVILNLWENQLASLPVEIGLLKNLRVLFTYKNLLTEIPEELSAFRKLEVLSLANNLITGFMDLLHGYGQPKEDEPEPQLHCSHPCLVFMHLSHSNLWESIADRIEHLENLKILIVESNCIPSIPKTLCFLTLELHNVDCNDIQQVPMEPYQLRGLKKLAFWTKGFTS
ncbi:Leucine-rich repeat-containing protein 30 [Acipenser ruthenus]|uniref:Leucine-rich repeat-containing protein 30 n=1 Tax=Acipenser ruthenus TaxID=7906 RepID=A0A444UPE7_ACIRT|nr:Leucine-rich repeat-containing protein 30 [Acipenser ruthenus]